MTTQGMEEDLIPVRMLNEIVYCPRLFYLEYVAREFVESHDTLDGLRVHQNVNRSSQRGLKSADDKSLVVRSMSLSSESLGIIGIVDLAEVTEDIMIPVEYKRGSPPNNPEQSWEPERVQLCLQAMLIEKNGYRADYGILYYAASKTRVRVQFTNDLRSSSLKAIEDAKRLRLSTFAPPPLRDSPKCPRCSLVGICLPDETNALRLSTQSNIRPIIPLGEDALPLYVVTPGAIVGKRDQTFVIRKDGEDLESARIGEVNQIAIFGGAQMSEPATRAALDAGIPIMHFSFAGWLSGITVPTNNPNVIARIEQFKAHGDPDRKAAIARSIVEAKIRNQRTLVRRSLGSEASSVLRQLAWIIDRVPKTNDVQELLGYEGLAARSYFDVFSRMLRTPMGFDTAGRNRRPPMDPVNALLSFLYTLLIRDATAAILGVGLDPAVGMYHTLRPGRPSLALDLAEEFRAIIADSVVLSVINTGEITELDFIRRIVGTNLTTNGRKSLISAYERRMSQSIRHPLFGYTISYRRILGVQARLLSRAISGEIERYPAFTTR